MPADASSPADYPGASANPSAQVGPTRVNGIAAGIEPLAHVPNRCCNIDGGGEESNKVIVKRGHSKVLRRHQFQASLRCSPV
jgi:hypothetical protein